MIVRSCATAEKRRQCKHLTCAVATVGGGKKEKKREKEREREKEKEEERERERPSSSSFRRNTYQCKTDQTSIRNSKH